MDKKDLDILRFLNYLKYRADQLRNKELDYENQSLIDFLYDLTEEKIKIDNPKYK